MDMYLDPELNMGNYLGIIFLSLDPEDIQSQKIFSLTNNRNDKLLPTSDQQSLLVIRCLVFLRLLNH